MKINERNLELPKKHYQKPMVRVVEFVVEQGFSGSLEQLPTIGPWEGWTRALDDFTLEPQEEE